jgi:hypothetical protein
MWLLWAQAQKGRSSKREQRKDKVVIGQSNEEIASTEHSKDVESVEHSKEIKASTEKLIQTTGLEIYKDILKRRDQVIE